MRQKKQWVVTFNGASARAFTFNGAPRSLLEIPEAHRTGPHKPVFEDRPVRVYSSAGAGDRRSGASPETDPERRLEEDFVDAFAAYLEMQRAVGAFDELIVAASPRALGAFRKAASLALAKTVVQEIHRDYVNADTASLRDALALK